MAEVIESDGDGGGLESDDTGLEIQEYQYFLFIIVAAQDGSFLILCPFADAPVLLLNMQL